jgi:small subunit ribosomal protein S29
MQHVYVFNMLRQLRKSNDHVLRGMTMLAKHQDVSPELVPHGSTLSDLLASAKEAEQAWPVLQALWAELMTPNPDRRPVLFSLDGLAHIMRVSDYRSPAFELIHSHDLGLVRRFVDLLSGGSTAATTSAAGKMPSFPAGGAVIGATSLGNAPKSVSMELALTQREAAKRGESPPVAEPYKRGYDPRVEAALATVDVMRSSGLSRAESRALMEYWAASGLLRAAVDEKKVVDVWSVGGNGVIGEMERTALMTMRI